MKLLVCVPSYRTVTPGTTQGLVALSGCTDKLAAQRYNNAGVKELAWIFADGWALPRAQNDALERTLAGEFDGLVFIESDIAFLPADFARLVESWRATPDPDRSVVAAAYPASWAMGRVVGSVSSEHGRSDEPAEVAELVRDGVVKAAKVVGTGFVVIGAGALRRCRDAVNLRHRSKFPPRVFREEVAEDGSTVTSDVVFSREVRNAGCGLYLDFGCGVRHHCIVVASLADVVKGWEEAK